MARYDIKSKIVDNDIVYEESDQQHIEDTINMAPGWSKEFPNDGVNIRMYLNSTGMEQQLSRSIKFHLSNDLYRVENPIVDITGSQISINPNASI